VDPEQGIVGSVIRNTDEEQSIQAYGGGRVIYPIARHHPCLSPVADDELDYISGASMLIRAELLQEIGLFDDRIFIYWEDVELSHRARRAGYGLGCAADAEIYHTEHASMEEFTEKREFYYNQGLTVFFKSYVWYWPAAVGTYYTVKLLKTLVKGKLNLAKALTRGIRAGIKA